MKNLFADLQRFLGRASRTDDEVDYDAPPPWSYAPAADVAAPNAEYRSRDARDALDVILRRGVGVALAQTVRGDVFAPIAVVVDDAGKDHLVLSESHVRRDPREVDLVAEREVLLQNVKQLRPRAAAVFADANVRLPGAVGPTEAVIATFEHGDGTCLTVVVPYDRCDGAVRQRAPFAMRRGGESLLR